MSTHVDAKPTTKNLSAFAALAYGTLCYLIFLVALVYSFGFISGLAVPKSIDSGATAAPWQAIGINALLLSLFALQHTIMARPAFKRWWTRVIPSAIERSTYVLFASLALLLLYWQWRPLPGTIWDVQQPMGRLLIYGIYGLGWVIVITTTFLINHADLFGLRQVYTRWQAKRYTPVVFTMPALYHLVRHPMMDGFLLLFWATPHMTIGHLLFAVATTGYILVGIQFEEHDLLATFGQTYQRYRQQVPMLLPFPRRRHARPE